MIESRFNSRWMVAGAVLGSLLPAAVVRADGLYVDQVYDPYVQPMEKEFEYLGVYPVDDNHELDGAQMHLLSAGMSLNDRWYAELGVEGEAGEAGAGFEWSAAEAEVKWQLTEQGEYAFDWGLLFELEVERETHAREFSTSVIVLREWQRWVGTLNAGLVYEWGNDINNEWETQLASQLRYRWSSALEPALELYLAENSRSLGPVLTGRVRFGGGRSLRWETGVLLGLDGDTPDSNWKLLLEYEFY